MYFLAASGCGARGSDLFERMQRMSDYQSVNPDSLMAPTGPWSHGLRIDPGKELLFVTGQVAAAADGSIPDTVEAQAERVWENVLTVLAAAGMEPAHIVRTGVYVTSPDALPAVNAVRNRVLGDARPATTVLVVAALANPRYLVEVDVIAAR